MEGGKSNHRLGVSTRVGKYSLMPGCVIRTGASPLIDDNVEGKGQNYFQGELIHFGSQEFPDWMSVRKALGN